MWFNSDMMKANPEHFQLMFLCPPKYTLSAVSDIEINQPDTLKIK